MRILVPTLVTLVALATGVLTYTLLPRAACAAGYCANVPCIDSSICLDGCACISGRCTSFSAAPDEHR